MAHLAAGDALTLAQAVEYALDGNRGQAVNE